MHDQLLARLTSVFREVFDDESLEVGLGTTAKDVDGWDSLTHIRLMLNVERSFGCRLTASEIGRLKSVGDLVEVLVTKVPG